MANKNWILITNRKKTQKSLLLSVLQLMEKYILTENPLMIKILNTEISVSL